MMGRVATSFAYTSGHLAGEDPVAARDDTDERFPEKAWSGALSVAAAQDSIALLAARTVPHPTSAPPDRDAFH